MSAKAVGLELIEIHESRKRKMSPDDFLGNYWNVNEKNIAGIRVLDDWYYESNIKKTTMTHGDLLMIVSRATLQDSFINKWLAEKGIVSTRKTFSKKIKEEIRQEYYSHKNTYNFRYFQSHHCLTFWGDKEDINLGLVGEIIRELKLDMKDLTIIFYNLSCNSEIHLASELNLNLFIEKEIKNPLSMLPSMILHMIACKKAVIEGFGSRYKRIPMPHSKYKLLTTYGD